MPGKILVVGSSNTDMILQMEHIPRPGETILGGRFSMAAGGKGANQAVAAARAGGRVTFLARVGDDLFGRRAIEGLVEDQIDVDCVIRDSEMPSGVALIFVADDGENSIGVASGANGRLSPDDIDAARDRITASEILVMQLETPIETVGAAARIAAQGAVRVILNPAPAQPLDDDLLKHVSVLTPNESEAERLTGIDVVDTSSAARAAQALRDRGVETVIVTLGSRGALVASREGVEQVPAFDVQPVDTTAAGDVFNGALAVGLAEEKPLLDAVRFASAAAALSTMTLGAQPSAPSRQAIQDLLRRPEAGSP